ncbi:cysteine proteinase inhibitor 1-like [Arachis duranensis]|uniref:Cysteine proteinase inhibitor 1-like n=1 Tax=Arachis duranensis TaxID=130453 RepID=A0A6P5MQE3_ARADU|nr:cysteine proteinase inhibitor 1-like [Arachis duranensis]
MDSTGDKKSKNGVDGIPNIPVITREQLRDYYRRPQSCPIVGGSPPFLICDEGNKQRMTDLAKRCLQVYNDQNEKRFEFLKLLNVERQCVAGSKFYITFTARSADNAFEIFCGHVWHKIDDTIQVTRIATKQLSIPSFIHI